MKEQTSTMSEVGQSGQLTLEKALKLFLLSFRFSQGHTYLQSKIFDYLKSLHPEWHMSDDFAEQLRENAIEVITKFSEVNKRIGTMTLHKSISDPARETNSMFLQMKKHFNDVTSKKQDTSSIILALSFGIITRDFIYLCRKGIRERSATSEKHKYSPALDPFLSHICYYGFEGNKTGVEEYDHMFKDVNKVALAILYETGKLEGIIEIKEYREKLRTVIDKYAQTHTQSTPLLKNLGLLQATTT